VCVFGFGFGGVSVGRFQYFTSEEGVLAPVRDDRRTHLRRQS
jgi:hypothetical protein